MIFSMKRESKCWTIWENRNGISFLSSV